MIKYKITHAQLMYYVWCLKFGYSIGSCEARAKYQKWVKEDTLQHIGDCTSDPCPCERCCLQSIEIDAENILRDIDYHDKHKLGWCKRACLTDCNFKVQPINAFKAAKRERKWKRKERYETL